MVAFECSFNEICLLNNERQNDKFSELAGDRKIWDNNHEYVHQSSYFAAELFIFVPIFQLHFGIFVLLRATPLHCHKFCHVQKCRSRLGHTLAKRSPSKWEQVLISWLQKSQQIYSLIDFYLSQHLSWIMIIRIAKIDAN